MAGFTIPNTPDAFNANQAEPDSIDFQVLGNRTSGIIGSSFAVTPGSGTTVSVSAGELVLNGVYYKTASPQTVTLTTFSGDSFFDLIVARVSGGVITCTKLAGNAGANPRYSSAVNHDTDIVLAAVWRDGSTVDTQRIIDKRTFVRSNNNRLGNNTPVNGNNGDIWVDTSTDWSAVASTAITASAHATSPVSVNVGGTWYKLASYRADLTPKPSWTSGDVASIVSRDDSGNFSANVISANLLGNVTGNVTGNASTASVASSVAWSNISGIPAIVYADGGTYAGNISGNAATATIARGLAINSNAIYENGGLWEIYGGIDTPFIYTTRVLVGDGSQTEPSIRFSNDTDTGIYHLASDGSTTNSKIRFTVNGTFVYQITTAGGSNASSLKYKENVLPATVLSSDLLNIEVVTFNMKGSEETITGVIAEQLDSLESCKQFVIYDDEGNPDAVAYDRLAVAYIEVIKNHEARLEALEAK